MKGSGLDIPALEIVLARLRNAENTWVIHKLDAAGLFEGPSEEINSPPREGDIIPFGGSYMIPIYLGTMLEMLAAAAGGESVAKVYMRPLAPSNYLEYEISDDERTALEASLGIVTPTSRKQFFDFIKIAYEQADAFSHLPSMAVLDGWEIYARRAEPASWAESLAQASNPQNLDLWRIYPLVLKF